MIDEKRSIWSVNVVKSVAESRLQCKVQKHMINRVMKEDFDLSYKQVRRIPFQGNIERNKVMRFGYAKRMLEVYQVGKRVINIDESWLAHADFHQKRWSRRGLRNTAADKKLSKKVNIIAAISNLGECWYSLLTCPVDSQVFRLFMSQLIDALDSEDPAWRNETIFLIDGVSKILINC